MKFLDLFAGIGGFRLGMEHARHECVGYVEIDKFARKSYEEIHDTEGEWTREDITKVADEEWRELRGTVDIICGGFPCQSFSIAGKRLGFEETRGTLFFEIARAAKQIQPRLLFLENVKGLLSHNKGETFATILTALHELGYDAEWRVLNSKDFGVPQNRERVFIVANLRGSGGREIFPFGGENRTLNKNDIKAINDSKKVREQLKFDSLNRFYDVSGIAPCLDTMQGGGREPKIAIVGNVNRDRVYIFAEFEAEGEA
ncbi:DNA (cytosine-5-)-methyltransferase [Listeria monocytogenes]|nr:DNA (cytosine-5-)-methyltransferase [Listeria monocytogenes]